MINSKKVLSHDDFIKESALSWIEQELYWYKAQVKEKNRNVDIIGRFHITRKRKQVSNVSTVSVISCLDA